MAQATVSAYTYSHWDGSPARLINRTTLDFIKTLRAHGAKVVVLPDDGTPIHYLIHKGDPTFLSDPLFVYLIGIPTSIITSLFATWLYERRSRNRTQGTSKIVLQIEEDGKSLFYSETGDRVSEAHAERVLQQIQSIADNLNTLRRARAEDPSHRFPICIEHSGEIIGWTHVQEDEHGLRMKDGIFKDPAIWERIDSGELRGCSIGGIATISECSICGNNYSECNHISGLEYEGEICVNHIKEFNLAEISLVKEPINQGCLIDLGLRR